MIVGIASDFYYASPMDEIAPVILRYSPEYFGRLVIDFNPVNKTELFSFIDQKWNQIEQTHPPRYKEVTEEMDVVFGIFDTLFGFVGYISLLSIVIALMGLLGIITFNVQARAKEIGIRKIMGAGAAEIVNTLAKDFIIIVIISLLVSISIVSFIAIQIKMMLPEFVGLDPLAMISGILIILSLVVMTIASHTVRALRANPIDALRYE
jgi:putative ABC transport system permease protein